ncbi:protein phosphatase methylesterase 1-like protein [Leptotrombidium deliense]|uniref:Protein phosphatase methylesterase 1 n=1 Tax=Leptotrombidium deliense TaxID=299467 RepID=A0A443SR42_9ACAR|nr:protein phosphatase methylesterase 1-like protein [Leptotrombidium deliense]
MDEFHKLRSLPVLRPNVTVRSSLGAGSKLSGLKRDFKPTSFNAYFDTCKHVCVSGNVFRIYLSGCQTSNCVTLVLLHGGGYSALTWAPFVQALRLLCDCRVIAIDLRGHGGTNTDNDYDLSMNTLCSDVSGVLSAVIPDIDLAPVVIIGHSMGGALAIHCAHKLQNTLTNFAGLVVIDVVEGTALEALKNMKQVLKNRPKSFNSLRSAVEWCYRSGMTRNLEAAKVSMPGQLKNVETNKTATEDIHNIADDSESVSRCRNLTTNVNQIVEEEESDVEKAEGVARVETQELSAVCRYVWRIDLEKTEPCWNDWFQGLSELFLTAPIQSKLLILAGVDRLDRPLTIGQMQGKFQTEVLSRCGHAAHEDDPNKVAEIIATFLRRNRLLPPK